MECAFCPRSALGCFALTSYDERRDPEWVRSVEPLCARCRAALGVAGSPRRRHKRTGVTWYGGHTVGQPRCETGVRDWGVESPP